MRTLLMAVVVGFAMSSLAQADPVEGPVCTEEVVLSHSTDVYEMWFYGEEASIVTVSGDGDTDLDLYVYDEKGNLIAQDEDLSDQAVVYFAPRWTGRFTIRVVNRGSVYNRYTICAG